jgi:hypothetical protein
MVFILKNEKVMEETGSISRRCCEQTTHQLSFPIFLLFSDDFGGRHLRLIVADRSADPI